MILSFKDSKLLDEFDDCDTRTTDELLSDFSEMMLLEPDCIEIVEGLDEHLMAVLVLLALRQYNSDSTPET